MVRCTNNTLLNLTDQIIEISDTLRFRKICSW